MEELSAFVVCIELTVAEQFVLEQRLLPGAFACGRFVGGRAAALVLLATSAPVPIIAGWRVGHETATYHASA